MKKTLTIAAIVAMLTAPAMVSAEGLRSIEDRTDVGWCRYVPYVGWVCGWHD